MTLSWPKLGDARRLVMPVAVFALGPAVDRAAFRAFVAIRDLPSEFPGMRGLGFLQRVEAADLKAFEAAQRVDGAPGFSVRAMQGGTADAGRHPHWVVKFMEPAADHAALPGLDVGTDTARREAIERAVATGQPALTAVTALPGRTQPSLVLYLPVFRHGAPLSTPAQRHAGLVGLLFAPVAVLDAPSGELDVFAGAVDVALFDNAGQMALGHSPPGSAAAATAAAGLASADTEQHRFESLRTLPLFGRDVTVRVRSKPVFEAQHPRSAPWAVLAGGLVASLLLAVLFRRQAFGRRRAEALAEHMTADLDRLAQIARHTTHAVLITDRQWRITWINAGFTRISGYTQAEALGRTASELLGSGKADPAVLRLLASNEEYRRMLDLPPALLAQPGVQLAEIVHFDAARGGYGDVDIEATVQAVIGRARAATAAQQHERLRGDGTLLEIRRAPMPGGGFVTTYTDISERKLAEAKLKQASDLLRGSIDALDEGFALLDPDDRMVLCNQRYRDLYPLAAPLMVPGNTFEQIIRGGAARGQYAAAVGREEAWLKERMAVHRQPASELQTRLGDGRTMRVVERRMPDGHTVGFRIDITAFVRATEAAQEASRSKGQFLANMSHEIRTPMNAILGMLALLRKTELTARQADYAQKTEGAARSLLGLLNDILDFSKVEAGKMTLDPQPFRVDRLLRVRR